MKATLCKAPTQITPPEIKCPTLFNKYVGSLTSHVNHVTLKMQETGPTIYIFRYNFKVSTFFSVMVQSSLCSKSFRGVWEQRKTEERNFWCFDRLKIGARAKKKRKEGGRGRGGKETLGCSSPSSPPSFLFWLSPPFWRGQNTESPVPSSSLQPHRNSCHAG